MTIIKRVSVKKPKGTKKVQIIELGAHQSEIEATQWNNIIT